MIPVGITSPVSQWGVSGTAGYAPRDIHDDVVPLPLTGGSITTPHIAWMYGRKIATIAKIVRAGVDASGLDLPDAPYGYGVPPSFPAELDALDPEAMKEGTEDVARGDVPPDHP
jgi:hypothetical protein